MSHLEEKIIRRHAGSRILLFGAAVAGFGALPLLLYIAFGPADGNPIGLGLLAFFALPIGAVIAAVGLVKMLVAAVTHQAS